MIQSHLLCLLLLVFGQSSSEPEIEEHLEVVYRAEDFVSRGESINPTLIYDQTFFQRFEPQSVGDMLKRIVGISGTADAGEFTQVQMRGLEARHTQILINGEPVSGAGKNRTFAVDRIPAALVERIEVIRAPSADQSGQAIAGAINIVLKEGRPAQGNEFLMGLDFDRDDNHLAGQFSAHWHRLSAQSQTSLAISWQDQHNPKFQEAQFQEADEAAIHKRENNHLDDQNLALHFNHTWFNRDDNRVQLRSYWLHNNRKEREVSLLSPLGTELQETPEQPSLNQSSLAPRRQQVDDEEPDGEGEGEEPFESETQFDFENSDQNAASINVIWNHQINEHHQFDMNYAFDHLRYTTHADIGKKEDSVFQNEEILDERSEHQSHRLGFKGKWSNHEQHNFTWGARLVSSQYQVSRKVQVFEDESDKRETTTDFDLDELEAHLFLSHHWQPQPRHDWLLGLRASFYDRSFTASQADEGDQALLPSLHYRWKPNRSILFHAGLARTLTLPGIDQLQPLDQRNEPLDGFATRGNPLLKAETAFGLDLGFTYQWEETKGLLGIHLFRRQVDDLIQSVAIDAETLQPQNIEQGETQGIEIEVGMPMTILGWNNLSIFANGTWQDSELTDPITGELRSFNLHSDWVVNGGFLHRLGNGRWTWGGNYIRQGPATEWLFYERVDLQSVETLELLAEVRLRKWGTLRLTARNLNNGTKRLNYQAFDGDRTTAELTERGRESEGVGRSYSLVFRTRWGR